MNTYKRYLALAATAIICTASLPLGAMKQPELQKTTKIQLKNTFLLKATQHDFAYIEENIKIMPIETVQIALNALKGQEESETYQIIANYLSQQPNIEKKRKRKPSEETPEETKKRKINEEAFLKAVRGNNIKIIIAYYEQMSDETIQKAINLAPQNSTIAKFLSRITTQRNQAQKDNANQKDDKDQETLTCPICADEQKELTCSICLNQLSNENNTEIPFVALPCDKENKISHDFHLSCLEAFVKTCKNIKSTFPCPLCKKEYNATAILSEEEIKKIEQIVSLIERASLGEKSVINYIIKNNKLVDSSSLNTIFENLSKRDRFKLLREEIDASENAFDDNENFNNENFNFDIFQCGFTNREASPHANPIELFIKNSDVINKIDVFNIATAFENTLKMLNIETYLALVNNSIIFDKISLEPDIKKIFKAIAEEDDTTFNEIFKNISTKNIDEQILAYILAFSACSNSINIRQKALKEKNQFFLINIDLNQLPFIISYAIEKDYKDVIQEIFSEQNKRLFIETAQEGLRPVLIAARNTYAFFIIQYLYNTHSDLLKDTDRYYLYEQLYSAAKTGNLEIIKDFLDDKNSNLFKKTEKYRFHRAFVFAAKNGRTQIIQYFLNDKNITLFNGDCFIGSLSSEDSSTISIKYENYLHEALIHTIKNNHKDIILILLHNKTIIDKLTKEALESALKVANTEEIKNEINKAIEEKNK